MVLCTKPHSIYLLRLITPMLLGLAGLMLPAICTAAEHQAHAIAMYGSPKYPANFANFDYVNPSAPKGGKLRLGKEGTFDSFHPYIPKGNAISTGSIESLLIESNDEPFTAYGLIAESIDWPDDRSWVIFTLRPEARWHDGQPITADDVIWSFKILTTQGLPQYRFYYRSVSKVEKLGPRRVRFRFSEKNNRELPIIVGQIPILPKHYWANRDFTKTTLEPPLGSGPYRVTRFEAGRYVVQERVKDYWGKDLAVNKGLNNFAQIRTVYYRDAVAIRLALKSGDIDLRQENQAKAWALDYDIAAVKKGWLNKERVPHQLPTGMQGFVFNTRRSQFQDPRVREALGYAFDFEWTNRNLFFNGYTRTASYFSNSELAARDLPKARELAILAQYRGKIPERVFTTRFQPPTTDGSGWPRQNLLKARALLRQAGWQVRDMQLVNTRTGKPFRFEILLVAQAFERIVLPFAHNLKRLGIAARVRLVDQSQYINRLRSFDYDMLISVWGQSENPGNEQRSYWTSAAAKQSGSRNLAGIHDPVVDQLVDGIISAPNRAQLLAYTKALDRVLLWSFYVIPNWHIAADRVLYWNKFSRPTIPVKVGVMVNRWWYDPVKAANLLALRADDPGSGSSRNSPSKTSSRLWWGLLLVLLAGSWLLWHDRRRKH